MAKINASTKQTKAANRKLATLAINRAFAKKEDRLLTVLRTEDNFRAIILGTSYLEVMLRLIIDHRLPNAKALPFTPLAQMANFAVALGAIKDDTGEALKLLGGIRNLFAHSVVYVIHVDDVASLRKAFDKLEFNTAGFMDHISDEIRKRYAEVHSDSEELQPHETFVRAAIFSLHLVLLGVHEMDNEQKAVIEKPPAPQSLQDAIMSGLLQEQKLTETFE